MNEILDQKVFDNTLWQYLSVVLTFSITLLIVFLVKSLILKRLKVKAEKTTGVIDNFVLRGIEKTIIPILVFTSLYFSLSSLKFNEDATKIIHSVFVFLITFFVIRAVISTVKILLNYYVKKKDEGDTRKRQFSGIINLLSFFLWILGLIFLLDNLGFEVSAVIAGLGIGGIAIALAAQAILGDLFSYFVIFFDRPFEIGDFIAIGDKSGAVENIGIKTTRLRSLTGEQLIVSNTDLTNSRVHNYKRMERRRVAFTIKIGYDTPREKLKNIASSIESIIKEEDNKIAFDRSNLLSFGDIGYNFEAVYYVNSSDYNMFAEIQQRINLKIVDLLSSENIKIAEAVIPQRPLI